MRCLRVDFLQKKNVTGSLDGSLADADPGRDLRLEKQYGMEHREATVELF